MRNGSERAPARWLIALAACCVFAAAHAERADRDKPVNLEADQVTVDDNKQTGWSINGGQGKPHTAIFQLAEPLKNTGEFRLLGEDFAIAPIADEILFVQRHLELMDAHGGRFQVAKREA